MVLKKIVASILLVALCVIPALATAVAPASAAVSLLYFRATPGGTSIQLSWQTATELDVLVFRIYRSQMQSPDDWGQPLTTVRAEGDVVTGHTYQYTDTTVSNGIKYYYLLSEQTSTGEQNVATVSAGIGLPADTATPTNTPTLAATWTRATTPTATVPGPTATRKYTDSPPTAVPGTAAPRSQASPTQPRAARATPLPAARLATPTGPAPRVTLPAGVLPTSTFAGSPIELPTVLPPATPTPDLAQVAEGALVDTPTPLPTKDVTPVIFSSEGEGTATPGVSEQAAAQGGRSTTLAFVLGGSAVGLAALAAAALLFFRSRRP